MRVQDCATSLRRWFDVLVQLIFSPLSLIKELLLCAGLIGMAIWMLHGLQSCWVTEHQAAASSAILKRPSISRVLATPEGSELLVFSDFHDIATIDEDGEERLHFLVTTPECLQLGRSDSGWSFAFIDHVRNVHWQHTGLGEFKSQQKLPYGSQDKLSLSADGMTLAILHQQREIRLLQRQDDGSVSSRSWPVPQEIKDIYLSPNGRRMVLLSPTSNLEWFDPSIGKVTGRVESYQFMPISAAWSFDERSFAIGTDDNEIHVWREGSESGPVYTLDHPGMLFSLEISADGRWVVAGSATGHLTAWRDGRLMWTVAAHGVGIRGLDLTAHDTAIITASIHGEIKVHSLESGELLREISYAKN